MSLSERVPSVWSNLFPTLWPGSVWLIPGENDEGRYRPVEKFPCLQHKEEWKLFCGKME